VATLTGTGQVVLGGDLNNHLSRAYGGSFVNDINHTIRGGGTINAPVTNNGKIIADNQTLQVNANITGTGKVSVQGTDAANKATLKLNAHLTTGTLNMNQHAVLDVASGKTITLSGNFIFAQTEEALWKYAATTGSVNTLTMNGLGPHQRLEIGGQDKGLDISGFSNNFDINNLNISDAGTFAFLTDWLDNGNRASDEALYVDNLNIFGTGNPLDPHATLNLNNLHLYILKDGSPYLVTTADSFKPWVGGGEIIDAYTPIPTPSTILLLGSGLLGLLGGGFRFRKK